MTADPRPDALNSNALLAKSSCNKDFTGRKGSQGAWDLWKWSPLAEPRLRALQTSKSDVVDGRSSQYGVFRGLQIRCRHLPNPKTFEKSNSPSLWRPASTARLLTVSCNPFGVDVALQGNAQYKQNGGVARSVLCPGPRSSSKAA